jgi:hypothetical protein
MNVVHMLKSQKNNKLIYNNSYKYEIVEDTYVNSFIEIVNEIKEQIIK